MPPKRMTANPVKPARYRAGKVTGPEESSSSDSEAGSDDEANKAAAEPAARAIPPPPKASSAGKITSNAGLSKVDLNQRRKEAQAKEAARLAQEKAERLAAEEGFVTDEGEDEEEEEDEDEEDEGSSSEEESSEDERPRRLMLRPKFVPKNQRAAKTGKGTSSSAQAADQEDARHAAEETRRKAEADALVEEQIKKDLAARAAGRAHWEDAVGDDGGEGSDVDTTDELDPEAEEAAWRLRELRRVKRERDRIAEQEAEVAERERRANLTKEERDAEDAEKLERQREDKESRGKMGFMQKYYHKGAFYNEELEAAGLADRDLMGARIADDVRDRSALPEYLQRRDMTQIGRKGATKYKDLKSEDTGRWGEFRDHRPGRDRYGPYGDVDERFRPDDDRGDRGPKGANTVPLGERKGPSGGGGLGGSRRGDDRSGERGGDSYRPRRDQQDDDIDRRRRDRSKTPSRSPPPPRRRDSRDQRDRRKRSPSSEKDRFYESEKRRKVDVT